MVRDRFLREEQLSQLIVESSVTDVLARLRVATPTLLDTWIDREKLAV